jgi:sodium/bile acid cotransporter 2
MTSDARVVRSAVSYVLLFLLIFGLAGTVDHAEFRKQFKEKRALALGFFGQFVMLPFLGFCAVKAFDLASLTSGPGDANRGIEAVILLLTTSSPGGSYSNWWCFLFNADLALSVAMTTVSSIASVVMLPLNLAIYLNATGSTNIDVEYGPLSVAVAIVVAGIGAGLFASSKLPTKKHVFHTLANVSGLSLIALGFISTSGSRDGLFNQPWNFFVGCAAPCVLGIALATGTALSATTHETASRQRGHRDGVSKHRARAQRRARVAGARARRGGSRVLPGGANCDALHVQHVDVEARLDVRARQRLVL